MIHFYVDRSQFTAPITFIVFLILSFFMYSICCLRFYENTVVIRHDIPFKASIHVLTLY